MDTAHNDLRRGARATTIALAVLALAAFCAPARASSRFVDPLIGTGGEGNTYPGAKVPFGFVSASPDTTSPSTAGYDPQGQVLGFSQTHVSGTAGESMYGNFRITPLAGALRVTGLGSPFAHERASPGYYSTLLTRDGIRAGMSATRMAALYSFRFAHSADKYVLLDATSVIEVPGGQRPTLSDVEVAEDDRIEGTASFRGGWNKAFYRLHFSLQFDRDALAAGVFRGDEIRSRRKVHGGPSDRTGAWMSFGSVGSREVRAKIGVSFISRAQARRRADDELRGFSLERARSAAERQWAEALGKITVDGGSKTERTTFYTALYHSQLMPHDLRGENVWWRSGVPHYEDYFTLWDTFRTQHPLLTLIQPRREAEMVESLVDTYRNTGWMPDARVAGRNGNTQVGSNGDVLVADALVKGLRGIDYPTAFRALVRNGERTSPKALEYGRELADYKSLGYVSLREGRSASRTLEYSYDDFAIAIVAAGVGRPDVAALFLARSHNWKNLWDPSTRSIRPRHPDGRFLATLEPHQPFGGHEGFAAPFFEGTPRQYSTFVPHEVARLIEKVGGDDAFGTWLDELFTGNRYDPGNEPGMLAPYLYIHAGRPDRTAERVRNVVENAYAPGRGGLPGNDDAGALSSWYVWSALGIFPNAGQPFYYIGSPLFPRAQVDLSRGGRKFVIEAPETSATNRYVQAAALNGGPIDRAWLTHQEVAGGGTLTLKMGPAPTGWGRAERPPSL